MRGSIRVRAIGARLRTMMQERVALDQIWMCRRRRWPRAPDAAQRFFSGALQSRGPSRRMLGPGSAEQRCTLHRVRDTDESYENLSAAQAYRLPGIGFSPP